MGWTQALVAAALVLSACSSHDASGPATSTTVRARPPASASHTILDYINGDADLSTLASWVRGTAIERTLRSAGPLTLFAPTNEALADLPSGIRAQLTNADTRVTRLNLHIVKRKLTAADLIPLSGMTIDTLGGAVQVSIEGPTLYIGSAPITRTDVLASNGVIHLMGNVVSAAS